RRAALEPSLETCGGWRRALPLAAEGAGGGSPPRGRATGALGVPYIPGPLEAVNIVSKVSSRNLAQEVVKRKLDEETIQQAVEELIQALLYAEKDLWAYCGGCRKKVPGHWD